MICIQIHVNSKLVFTVKQQLLCSGTQIPLPVISRSSNSTVWTPHLHFIRSRLKSYFKPRLKMSNTSFPDSRQQPARQPWLITYIHMQLKWIKIKYLNEEQNTCKCWRSSSWIFCDKLYTWKNIIRKFLKGPIVNCSFLEKTLAYEISTINHTQKPHLS